MNFTLCMFIFLLFLYKNLAVKIAKEEYKITVVIDPGKNESYWELKTKSEELFENVASREKSLNVTLDIVNAARGGEAVHELHQEDNPLRITRQKVCTEIMNGSVVVILIHPKDERSLATATSYALGFYDVPVISVSSRDVEFSDKTVYSSFLRTLPPYSEQAKIWYYLLTKLDYYKVIFIFPDESNAQELKTQFLKLSQNKIEPDYIEYDDLHLNLNAAHSYLQKVNDSNINVILFYANTVQKAELFFTAAADFGLLNSNRLWIVNEEVLRASNAPIGLLGVQLNASRSELRWIALEDAYKTIFKGLKDLKEWSDNLKINITVPSICDEMEHSQWMSKKIGATLYQLLINVKIYNHETGTLITFDEAGDRTGFPYSVINVDGVEYSEENLKEISEKLNNRVRFVGAYGVEDIHREGLKTASETTFKLGFAMDENRTVWPANSKEKPPNVTLKKHIQVVTVVDEPFVWKRELKPGQTCASMPEIQAPWTLCVNTTINKHYCCAGLVIDLLMRIAQNASFTFDLHLSKDGYYGKKIMNPDGNIRWNGVVGELVRTPHEADMAVAALTINEQRDAVVDFSKPWLYTGITILEKKKPRLSPMESFMQPFTYQLWICLFSSVVTIGFVLFMLDKYSPFSKFYKQKSDNEDDQPLNFSGSMWFVWGVLLDSGIGERTPRALSARVMGMVWCGFSMIMVASYTANLAAFLVLDQPEKKLSGITDMKLRNPTTNFTYATVESSNVYNYFKEHIELQTMFRTMEGRNFHTSDDAIKSVLNNKLDAFIWDSTRLTYVVSRSCDLITSGEIFGRSAYGIALPKGSDWTSIISLIILHMHESGEMEDLESKWIASNEKLPCKDDDDTPVRLGLKNMRDLFVLVAGGIVVGFFFISIEIFYKKRKLKRLKRKQLGLHYGRLWRTRARERRQRKDAVCTQPMGALSPSRMPRIRRQSTDSFEIPSRYSTKTFYSPIPVEYCVTYRTDSPRNRSRWSSPGPDSPGMGNFDQTVNPDEGCSQQSFHPAPPSYGEYQAYVPRKAVIV